MFGIQSCPLPESAPLARYRLDGAFTDCYAVDIRGAISHARYVAAFYTTAVFKLERLILKWAVSRPSTDAQAEQLAAENRRFKVPVGSQPAPSRRCQRTAETPDPPASRR